MSSSDAERELWRQTRKCINDYEDKAAELQLDLRRERSALDCDTKRQKEAKQEAEQQRQYLDRVNKTCNEQRIQLLALQKQSHTASVEAERLTQQLQLLEKNVQGKQQTQQQKREMYAEHLKAQRAVLKEYTAYCSSTHQ